MNPLECEAVVAAALEMYGGACEIEPGNAETLREAGLQTRSGLETWKVPAELPSSLVCSTMAPPSAKKITEQLAHTIRLLPHDIDGSGFFVAVFTKTSHRSASTMQSPGEGEVGTVREAGACEHAGEPGELLPRVLPWRARNDLNCYEVVRVDSDAEAQKIASWHGLNWEELPGAVVAERNIHGVVRQLLLLSWKVLSYLQGELGRSRSPLLLACGVPLFKKLDDGFLSEVGLECRWRPALEAATILSAHCRRRVLLLSRDAIEQLLKDRRLSVGGLREMALKGDALGLDELQEQVGGVLVGLQGRAGFWLPGVVTAKALEVYASAEELGPVPGSPVLPRPQVADSEVRVRDGLTSAAGPAD